MEKSEISSKFWKFKCCIWTLIEPSEQKFCLDVKEMKRAASHLAGQPLDMTSFTNVRKGSVSDGMTSRDPICTIDIIRIRQCFGENENGRGSHFPSCSRHSIIEVDVHGSRFLYNMVWDIFNFPFLPAVFTLHFNSLRHSWILYADEG